MKFKNQKARNNENQGRSSPIIEAAAVPRAALPPKILGKHAFFGESLEMSCVTHDAIVGTTNRSIDAMPSAWFRRKAHQL